MLQENNSVTLRRVETCLTTIKSSGIDIVHSAVSALSTVKEPIGRYLILDLLDTLHRAGFTNMDYLGPYTVPDVPLGQSWYSWFNLERALKMSTTNYTSIFPVAEGFLSEPSVKTLASLAAILRLMPSPGWSRGPVGMETAIPRMLATQDYRRGAFLYPDEEQFHEVTIILTLVLRSIDKPDIIRPRSMLTECNRRILALCDADIDPIVTWNRLSIIGHVIYLHLIHEKLRAICPLDASELLKAIHTHIEIISKEIPHEQSSL